MTLRHARILLLAAAALLAAAPAMAQHDDHDHDHGEDAHAHGGEDKHDDHGEGGVAISPEVMAEFGIQLASAQGGAIGREVRLPGEVVYNADRIAHVTPTVSGIVRRVNVSVGDRVEAGDVLAVLSSREVAAARSEYLTASARLDLARDTLERDRRLFDDKVGTERAVLEATQALREAEIALRQADHALHAMGFSHEQVEAVDALDHGDFSSYDLIAPIAGVVTQRHLTIGEVTEPTADAAPFVVADLSTVWVNLTVYQRDLAHVAPDQHVHVDLGHDMKDAEGVIGFVSPALDETTRTATARIVLDNADGRVRPGLFVTGSVETDRADAAVVVPRSAVTQVDGETVVFVQTDEGFEPRHVVLGRTTADAAEIVEGLAPGETFVATNVLAVKAELNRGALEHAGHAH